MGQNNMLKQIARPLAVLALAGMTACTGGPVAPTPSTGGGAPVPVPPAGAAVVGIGDSLTAGVQSNATLGVPGVTSPLSAYPGGAVPPGQPFGWFADFYLQLTGTPAVSPAGSILPLIAGPGLGSQIVINPTTLFANTHSECDAFNAAAFSPTGWTTTRANPSSPILDLGIGGLTMHESVAMRAPLTGPPTQSAAGCGFPTIPGDPTSGGLQSLVASESNGFYPTLGGFLPALGSNLTQLNAAAALKPQLTTVWLGGNDLLKFIFSAGQSPATDTPTQFAADLTQIITTMRGTGSKVLVANLPDVLSTPQFFAQPEIAADLVQISGGAIPPAAAGAVVSFLGSQYHVGPGGYLTESGFFAVVASVKAGNLQPNLDPAGPGSGLGAAYLPDAFAAQAQALNTAYNSATAQVVAASGSGVALVDIHSLFLAAKAGIPVGPLTANLHFGGGLASWDGLHPSNLGYALITNAFIGAADTGLGMTIPPLSAAQIGALAFGNGSTIPPDPYNPLVLAAGGFPPIFPLP